MDQGGEGNGVAADARHARARERQAGGRRSDTVHCGSAERALNEVVDATPDEQLGVSEVDGDRSQHFELGDVRLMVGRPEREQPMPLGLA